MDEYPSSKQVDVAAPSIPLELELRLVISDSEVIAELMKHQQGPDRERFGLQALRVGVLAIRQASGSIDITAVQQAAERMIQDVDKLVSGNSNALTHKITQSLQDYFDPKSGRVIERLDRLVRKDGELATLLCGHVDGDSSALARTLVKHVGENSLLLQMLSPTQKDGILSKLEICVNQSLTKSQETVLKEFSLNDPSSALSRLVSSISSGNGQLRKDLADDIKKVSDEFSLDNKDGALSRLVGEVKAAQETITKEFSTDDKDSLMSKLTSKLDQTHETVKQRLTLDQKDSPLSVLKSELQELIKGISQSADAFQQDVRETLGYLTGKKDEAKRGVQHGVEFEFLAGQIITTEAQLSGDYAEVTANTVGIIRNCKVGDHVITLGPESAAPMAKVVAECKEKEGYKEADAVKEIATARENRGAQVGIFVFSKETAPKDLPILRRVGNDILCVWDKQDAASDIVLRCAISVARAIAVRLRVLTQKAAADFGAVDKAVAKLEKDAQKLSEILTWAQNIARDSNKIVQVVEPLRQDLELQIANLREAVSDLRQEEPAQ